MDVPDMTRPDLSPFECCLVDAVRKAAPEEADSVLAELAEVLIRFDPTFNRQRFTDWPYYSP